MDSLSRGLKYSGAPSMRRCTWTVIAISFLPWCVYVNATEVRVKYRPQQQTQRAVKLSSDPRIIGGTPVAPGAYPFYVYSIQPILCGATLIAPDIVLTAAHCGGGFLAGVNIGGILLDGTDAVETLAVDSEFPHPDYNEADRLNDIMLVKLTDPSTLSPIVELNFDPSIPAVGDVVTVIGFGDTTDGGDPSNELLTVTVDTYVDDFCFNLYNSFVPETMICAGTVAGGRDPCQGDSGGPLLTADNVQIGIVSNGSGCGRPDIPAIYTEIAAFETFIREGICALSDTPPADCATTGAPAVVPVAPPSNTATPVFGGTTSPTTIPVGVGTASPTTTPVGGGTTSPTTTPVGGGTASPTTTPFGAGTASPTTTPVGAGTASPTTTPVGAGTASPTATPVGGGTSSPTPVGVPVSPPIGVPTDTFSPTETVYPTVTIQAPTGGMSSMAGGNGNGGMMGGLCSMDRKCGMMGGSSGMSSINGGSGKCGMMGGSSGMNSMDGGGGKGGMMGGSSGMSSMGGGNGKGGMMGGGSSMDGGNGKGGMMGGTSSMDGGNGKRSMMSRSASMDGAGGKGNGNGVRRLM